jgi:hypothetical protein
MKGRYPSHACVKVKDLKIKCPKCGSELIPTKGYKYDCQKEDCSVIYVKGYWRKVWEPDIDGTEIKFIVEKVVVRSC